jgi:putative PIN family toxin of toxin-antitoxin system
LIVVIDTNVWISALVFSKPGSVPGRVLKRIVNTDKLATSEELRNEIHRILTESCHWSPQRAVRQLDEIEIGAMVVRLRHNLHVCRDPKDDMFLECAALAEADVIVTGDKDLLSLGRYGSTRIITPIEYLALPA